MNAYHAPWWKVWDPFSGLVGLTAVVALVYVGVVAYTLWRFP